MAKWENNTSARINKYLEMVYEEIRHGKLSYYRRWKSLGKKAFYDRYCAGKLQYLFEEDLCGKKALDCGCGVGTESILMALLGANVLGVDVNRKRLREGKERLLNYEKVFNLKDVPELKHQTFFDVCSTFDFVFLNESFHHIEPQELFFKHLEKITNPEGKVLFLETNGNSPLLKLIFYMKRGVHKSEQKHGVCYGVENVVSLDHLDSKMRKNAFIKLKHTFLNVVPSRIQNLANFGHKVDKILCRVPVVREVLSSSYVVLYKKDRPLD